MVYSIVKRSREQSHEHPRSNHSTCASVIGIMDKGLKSLRRIDHYKKIYATQAATADVDDLGKGYFM